ncbi:MAG: D-alanine--D-alanine ligase [Proteobacteria bacterium]|nr:D-alanine--D-alanine ligase [Cystobacterineae bacterium]MCL2258730.1 D-alanine--D-alanine ligase [Cystobacterineae bacterium]MCL2314278.1 D-alanine--D-alanine ligase [Pseudomonadota bacterium]
MKPMQREEVKQKRVAVLKGGLSQEREVSLKTGAAIAQALRSQGYGVVEIDVGLDLVARLLEEKVEVAFIALHGRWGEDGCIQGLLESMRIPYTGSGVLASAAGMDKTFSKRIFDAFNIPTPPWVAFDSYEEAAAARLPFAFPLVVKPSREGSSIGVNICKGMEEYQAALRIAAGFEGQILVECFVKGREIQVGYLEGEILGAIEVVAARAFYDYQAKYSADSGTRYIFPAALEAKAQQRIFEVCLQANRALGCQGATRADTLLTPEGEVFLLEVNTLPGMTATSLLPKIAAGKGLEFGGLCERLLLGATLKA